MADQHAQEGTGKHPHKSTEEPYPHTKGQSSEGQQEEPEAGRQERQGGSSEGGGQSDDLKSREYRDAQGNVHHHTRTYQEQHKGENK
jgi:hypothetical protein